MARFPFDSVLVANRGEIAVRVIRTARTLGLRAIAVYSEADRDAPHVALADEAYGVGPAPAAESYLNIERIVTAARRSRAGALHPGYGFLSERAELAEACAEAGIVFIGPPPEAIRTMGDKAAAKALMARARVPIVPGYHGDLQEPKFLRQKAYEIGYPVLIKAAAGGGGKGMRRVEKVIEFDDALSGAVREAEAAFGDGRVLIEKWIESPRHIEVQVFADTHGNVLHLFERDCSAQRRHQKVIEESPAPGMTPEFRDVITRAAIAAAKAVNYRGAGTVEFVAGGEGALRPEAVWFMEMNTRLQVEHPVTEAVTGIDLVDWQFRVAAGEKLPLVQQEISLSGHAVEARLYAEDPERGFLPSTCRLNVLRLPSGAGIRVDSGVEEGTEMTRFYDPMLAKVIAHGDSREAAFGRLAAALDATAIAGPRTNVAFLRALMALPEMQSGTVDTGMIEREFARLTAPSPPDLAAAASAVGELIRLDRLRIAGRSARRTNERRSPWDTDDAFSLGGNREGLLPVRIEGERAAAWVRYGPHDPAVTIDGIAAAPCEFVCAEGGIYAIRNGRATFVSLASADAIDIEQLDTTGVVLAPMHGKILSVEVRLGERVRKGQRLAVLEAMKMEHALLAPHAGEISGVAVEAGNQVVEGAPILVILAEDGSAGGGATSE